MEHDDSRIDLAPVTFIGAKTDHRVTGNNNPRPCERQTYSRD